ncbi:hypothetical protein C8T65DRAFT_646634 [Cerioporus squamosus]|nr:hypothetical protein C8T65DRAFT_646634 [Cerioporus squamosus]
MQQAIWHKPRSRQSLASDLRYLSGTICNVQHCSRLGEAFLNTAHRSGSCPSSHLASTQRRSFRCRPVAMYRSSMLHCRCCCPRHASKPGGRRFSGVAMWQDVSVHWFSGSPHPSLHRYRAPKLIARRRQGLNHSREAREACTWSASPPALRRCESLTSCLVVRTSTAPGCLLQTSSNASRRIADASRALPDTSFSPRSRSRGVRQHSRACLPGRRRAPGLLVSAIVSRSDRSAPTARCGTDLSMRANARSASSSRPRWRASCVLQTR